MTDINKIPDEETGKIDYDQQFKRNTGVETLMGMDKEDGYTYKGVITNYPVSAGPKLVHNFEEHRKIGYEIVMTTKSIKDDRMFSGNSNERPNTVPAPLTGKTDDGFSYVVMRIPTEKLDAHLQDRSKKEYQAYLDASVTKVEKKGNSYSVTGTDTKF